MNLNNCMTDELIRSIHNALREAAPALAKKFDTHWVPNEHGEPHVSFPLYGGKMTVCIGELWDETFPHVFVNWSHPRGNFIACEGASSAVKAVWNISAAVQVAACAGDVPEESGYEAKRRHAETMRP